MVTDQMIDACGFRMFVIPEIARTMVMHEHPRGGEYQVRGNKRERMAKYGNAVTPPVHQLLLPRLFEVLGGPTTVAIIFCGAGGDAIGAEWADGKVVFAVNHWRSAVDDHAENFPDAEHDCADVSALTTNRIRSYPDSDILLASPECTNHSLAKGARRRKPQAASLWEDGPAGDDEQDRSRATMWDVCRFAEQKLIKGKPYKAIVVENVVDAFRWGADDNGLLFSAWRQAIEGMGYESEIVWLNSMFAWPTPQSRDRMYVVFWQKGVKRPNLQIEPVSWCPACELVVNGRMIWKRTDRPLTTLQGKPVGARYGAQYLFGCPTCHGVVLPGVFPAATAIDWSIEAPLIGDRARPLAVNTRERIRRGLERLAAEPFAIRLLQGGIPKPLTLPMVTLTQRHDMAVVLPVSANTYETTPGNRARDAAQSPMSTVHSTLDRAIVVPHSTGGISKTIYAPVDTLTRENKTALVMAYTEDGVPRPADLEAAQTQRTNPTLGLVMANREHGVPRSAGDPSQTVVTGGSLALIYANRRNAEPHPADETPSPSLVAGGGHLALVMRNNNSRGDAGQMCSPVGEPFRTLTASCHQSLVVPYQSEPHGPLEPGRTITTRDRLALVIPPSTNGRARVADRDPSFVQVTETRPMLVELPS